MRDYIDIDDANEFKCETCDISKISRKTYPNADINQSSEILELLQADLCSPIQTESYRGGKYFMVLEELNWKKTKAETRSTDSLFETTPDTNEIGHKTKVSHIEISAEPEINENNNSFPFQTQTSHKARDTVGVEIETPDVQLNNNGVNRIPVRLSERLKAKQKSRILIWKLKSSADWQN
ncbi:hypothetical protein AVEN_40960-1 [Araneus ventricosus]|uniref:Uncharacterized protein n=1 Tax=Araneus ventricosus TaxID=182803 RepID=A0A4Y2FA22_ARAVE|nr:hypothetical protein AVEN_40960-1 [Araneus ventricosus]